MKKVLTIIGARPQFIKASVVSREILKRTKLVETIVHTGQHFDPNMSAIFFNQLNIPEPDIMLDIHGGNHGEMTGRMLAKIEAVLLDRKPELVLVYGDTNSTLAGALAAAKLNIPVAHIEAGLRSFNMQMPEEVNRILTDQVSSLLFCPTSSSVANLKNEGFCRRPVKIEKVGDVMQDSSMLFSSKASKPKGVMDSDKFVLTTMHRAENTNDPSRLKSIVSALNQIHNKFAEVVMPLHPRTRKLIADQGLELNVNIIDPVGYFEMLWLLKKASLVLTDSGGVQKEAFFFNKACLTLRDETEWIELVEIGANELVGTSEKHIVDAAERNFGRKVSDSHSLYGGGYASKRIVDFLLS